MICHLRRMLRMSARSLAVVLVFAVSQAHATTIFLDDFSDGGVVLNSASNVVGSEGSSSALGGWRAFTFSNSFNSGTLTLDDEAGTLRITSTGLGQTSLTYGRRLTVSGTATEGTLLSAMNADLTDYVGLRFNILENEVRSGLTRMRLQVSLSTFGGGISTIGFLTAGLLPSSGIFDVPFASMELLGGGVNLADVDSISILIQNGSVGNTVAIGGIELIPVPEPASLALLALGIFALPVLRRRFSKAAGF